LPRERDSELQGRRRRTKKLQQRAGLLRQTAGPPETKLPRDKTSRNQTSQVCAESAATQKAAELTESELGSRDLLARAL